ncbi:hypothetical protein [Gottfriedia solisilvae]|uniref:Uncharacterized protein n=1 Tax=Gottfriedia solisilvae TaxID=1516104 RepID=A0A8J3AK83_9BACI|nr:hypothetical protein [Gottfriedia solisilvae]GGI16107.1 hypothetical protein GCM10007380_31310 [Gottfriedia solisilvae]
MIFYKALKYIAFLILLFGVTIGCLYINSHIQKIAAETYDYSDYILILSFLYVPIGLCLGLPQLLADWKKNGSWNINITKLIVLGIPALYLSGYTYIHYNIPSLQLWNSVAVELLQVKATVLSNVILGYIFITSFHK